MSKIMQMCADEIAGYLKRIAELEKELEDWQDGTIIAQWQDCEQKVKELEKQLAESERQYQEYRQIVKKDIKKEIDERMRDTIKEFNLDISQLKQQLAESEQEIEELRFKERNIFPLVKKLEQKVDQDKTDFAIECLEKVKYDFFDISNGWWLCFRDGTQYMTREELEGCVREVIDKQIQELKGD